MANRIKCNNVNYRRGYIEITPGIHDGCINLETWSVGNDIDLARQDIRDADFPDAGVTGNTEIELNVAQAHALVRLLEQAISEVSQSESAANKDTDKDEKH